jgi:RTX calcium-binding nonapeptide repeat (4 copies)
MKQIIIILCILVLTSSLTVFSSIALFNVYGEKFTGKEDKHDDLDGTDENDDIKGLDKDDTLNGLGGADEIEGGTGDDIIHGGEGDDRIYGNGGEEAKQNDNDKLFGDEGSDQLYGNEFDDELTGGSGSDSFNCGTGTDRILDFNVQEKDFKESDCEYPPDPTPIDLTPYIVAVIGVVGSVLAALIARGRIKHRRSR